MTNLLIVMMAVWLMTGCFKGVPKPDWIPSYPEMRDSIQNVRPYLGNYTKYESYKGEFCPTDECLKFFYENDSAVLGVHNEEGVLKVVWAYFMAPKGFKMDDRDFVRSVDFSYGLSEVKDTRSIFESAATGNQMMIFKNEDQTYQYVVFVCPNYLY